MRRSFLLLLILSIMRNGLGQSLQILEPGQYSVGFRSSLTYDLSRPAMVGQLGDTAVDARALQINLWYPSEQSQVYQKMTLYHYLLTEGENPFFTGSKIEKARKFYFRYNPEFIPYFDSLIDLNLSMNAYLEAPSSKGKFPTVILMHDGPTAFSVLAEYLASHGYVVINFPVFGSEGIVFDNQTNAVESELRDMEFVIGSAKKLPFADMDNLVLAGFSYGGLSITSFQMRHQSAKGIISFDTGITDSWGTGLMEKMPYYDLEKLSVPILHFWTENGSWTQELKWLDNYKYADRHSFQLNDLRHFDFTGTGLFRQYFPQWIEQMQGKELGDYVSGYRKICQETLEFLNSLTREAAYNPLPKVGSTHKEMAYQYFKALELPPSIEGLKEIYSEGGMEEVINIFNGLKSLDKYPFTERRFNSFARYLERNANPNEALEWVDLYKQIYPNSAQAYFRSAVIHERLSHEAEAMKAYRRVLELAPIDYALDRHFRSAYTTRASEKLEELEEK